MMRLAAAVLLAMLAMLPGCASRTPAPVDDRRPSAAPAKPPAAPQASSARAEVYVVKRGDTLYSIALEHGADFRELARWNKLEDPSKIRIGQELRVTAPEERTVAQVGVARAPREIEARPLDSAAGASVAPPPSQEGGMKTTPKALRLAYSEQNLAALSRAEARPEAKPEAAKPAPVERPADSIDFIWPAKGQVLAGFSEPRNKGVDIEGKLGDPVVAAAAGRVTYIGSGIPGLGKLVVIKHDAGFITVYAHNKEILVKEQQAVSRGQKIAEIGATDSDRPKLHFQIRKGSAPVDPMRYLPSS